MENRCEFLKTELEKFTVKVLVDVGQLTSSKMSD